MMATPLDQLLLGINPRTGQADHFIDIARWDCPVSGYMSPLRMSFFYFHIHKPPSLFPPCSYLPLSWESPELALSAVHILLSSCNSHRVTKEMTIAIGNNKVLCPRTFDMRTVCVCVCVCVCVRIFVLYLPLPHVSTGCNVVYYSWMRGTFGVGGARHT